MQKFATPLLLAYNTENEPLIKQITKDLGDVMDFKYAGIVRDQENSLTSLAEGYEGPVILFISDNFLRSTKCMQDGLAMLNEHVDQLLPVVTPGYRQREDGTQEPAEASFERVSDIIQYINFWQDRYLDLRRQKREDSSLSTPGFEGHLKIVRSISGEAGEYLRLLRGMEHLHLSDLTADKYRFLFEFLDAEVLREQLPDEPVSEVPAVRETPAEEVEEEAEATTTTEEEEPPVDLTSIPGIGLVKVPAADEAVSEEEEEEEGEEPIERAEPTPMAEELIEEPVVAEQEEEEEEEEEEDPVALLLDKSWRLADGGDVPAATALLSAGLDQFPKSDILQYNYALILAQQGENQKAKEIVDELLTRNPQHEAGLYLAAELADLEGKPGLAQKYLVRLVRLQDQGADVWYKLGLLSLQKDPPKAEQAERYFKEATKRKDSPAGAYYELGLLYNHHFGKTKKALKYFESARELEPEHPFVNYDIALLLFNKGKYKRANEAYQQAIAINPEIQTPENDAAFSGGGQKVDLEEEQDTLQALKDNVSRLESLLLQREQEITEEATVEAAVSPLQGTGKTVMITGATSGIGLATAEKYAAEGYRLIITGRREERLAELKNRWEESYGTETYLMNFDVRKADAAETAISSLPDEWFDIDILINNAGKAKGLAPIHEGQLEHWEEMIDTNVKGLLYITRAISPRMVARGTGHIINVASTAGKEVYPNGNVYCATKHAVDALTKAMRLDLHQHGVRVSQVAPAHVEETEFALVRFDGDAKRAKIYNDFKPLTSRDVAETIYFISQQPPHVNILDIVLQGTQQANSTTIDRSGRERYEEEE
ncbi:MAG: SDR family NAD(P)-dependent oxidoreductase [Bacteroidota bacterium]